MIALLVIGIILGYILMGFATAAFMHAVDIRAHERRRHSRPDAFVAVVSGVFWPIGMLATLLYLAASSGTPWESSVRFMQKMIGEK